MSKPTKLDSPTKGHVPEGTGPMREPAGPVPEARLLGLRRVHDVTALLERVLVGLPYSALATLQEAMALDTAEIAGLVQLSPRTLNRRREERRLHAPESDRLVRVARIFALTLGLFEGDREAARRWVGSPNRALAGEKPLGMARTEIGAREVEALIGRLEHGVFT